jgi:hypothetical protein
MGYMLNKSFSARLQKSHKGGWTYVVWPNSVKCFGTRGLVKVRGTINGHPFKSSFMAMGDGRHMLPVKVEIRRAIGKEVGAPSRLSPMVIASFKIYVGRIVTE